MPRRREVAAPSLTSDRTAGRVAVGLIVVALVLVFFLPANLFISSRQTDMVSANISWHAYLATSLRAGHLPLWDPYTYSGEPFLAGFEAGVFYPPNLLYLVLPLARAINFSILLHLIVLGLGMERWASRRGLMPWAAVLTGAVVVLSGSVYPHVYAGHLDGLCTMAWSPWILMGLERWWRQGERGGLFLASAAASFQIFAGHIQYFYYTAIAAGIFAVVASWDDAAVRRRALPAVAVCYLAALALGAAQILPGFAASTEGVRQQTLDLSFASMFSLAPENFLTLVAPEFFGSLGQSIYWGRCYLWEMTIFMGTAAPLLIAAALCDGPRRRQGFLDLAVAVPLLVLALGIHTPMFKLLYHLAPGYGHFRGTAKFIFPATLFLALIVGAGADLLFRGGKPDRRVVWAGLGTGVALFLAGVFLVAKPEVVAGMLRMVAASRESYLTPATFLRLDILRHAGYHAGVSLGLGGMILAVSGAALWGMGKWSPLRWLVPTLMLLEMGTVAWRETAVAHFSDAVSGALQQFVATHPGDYRVLNLAEPSNGFLLGAGDVSGNNPSVLRRYAEWNAFTQGQDPDHVTQYVSFRAMVPLDAMLRLQYAFLPDANGFRVIQSTAVPLPRLLLITDWRIPGDRNAIFGAMADPSFHPRETALLESVPDPVPDPDAIGSVKLISASPDELVIEAETNRSTLLLITDLYARDWKAEALPGSDQKNYELLPADYILRAVPLTAGHHRLRVVYAPVALPIGLGISVLAWLLWAGLLIRRRKR